MSTLPITLPGADEQPTRKSLGLWAGIVGSSALWAVQLQAIYGSVPVLCELHANWVSHAVSLVCFVGTVVCAVLSYRDWVAAGRDSPDLMEGGERGRTRFLGALGAIYSVLLAITILAQAIAAFFFEPCWA